MTKVEMSGQKRTPYQKGLTLEEAREETRAQRAALDVIAQEDNADINAICAETIEGRAENRALRAVLEMSNTVNQVNLPTLAALQEAQLNAPASATNHVADEAEDMLSLKIHPDMKASELLTMLERLESGKKTTTRPPIIPRSALQPRPRLVLRSFGLKQKATRQKLLAGSTPSYSRDDSPTNVLVGNDVEASAKIRRRKKQAARAGRDSERPPGLAGTHPSNYKLAAKPRGLGEVQPASERRFTNSGGPGETQPAYHANTTMTDADTTDGFPYEATNIDPRLTGYFPTPNYGGPGYFPEPSRNVNSAATGHAGSTSINRSSNAHFNSSGVPVSPRFAIEYQSPYTQGSDRYFGAKGYLHGRGGRGNGGLSDLIPGTMVGTSSPSTYAPSPSSDNPRPYQQEQSNTGNRLPIDHPANYEKKVDVEKEEDLDEYLNSDDYWLYLTRVCPQLAAEYLEDVYQKQQK